VTRQQKPSRQASVDEQIQVVLAVLKGELSLAEAARRHGVSSATVQLRIRQKGLEFVDTVPSPTSRP
jgi:transposase-like protein